MYYIFHLQYYSFFNSETDTICIFIKRKKNVKFYYCMLLFFEACTFLIFVHDGGVCFFLTFSYSSALQWFSANIFILLRVMLANVNVRFMEFYFT